MRRAKKVAIHLILLVLILLAGPALVLLSGRVDFDAQWSTASREPTGIAPDPATTPEAVVQVYGARTFAWRGAFAVHTWVAVKPERAPSFTTYEVIGWQVRRGGGAVSVGNRRPDRRWYGQAPELYVDLRGPQAAALIPQIEAAVRSYPFPDTYGTWPGPNSNTFTAHIGRQVPGLRLDLPPTAVGKDYLGAWTFWAPSPSGTGVQLSVRGIAGVLIGWEEGLELNLLGLTIGVDPLDLAIKLPGLGRLAPSPRTAAAAPPGGG